MARARAPEVVVKISGRLGNCDNRVSVQLQHGWVVVHNQDFVARFHSRRPSG